MVDGPRPGPSINHQQSTINPAHYRIPRGLVHCGCFVAFLVVFTLVVGVGFWLPALAGFLAVGERLPARADAIVVLGGGGTHGSREARAAQLYLAGVAPTVVTTGGPVVGTDEATYAEWSVQRLERRGVPRQAVVATYSGVSTLTDAQGARRLAEERGWAKLVMVTDTWHSRRSSVVFANAFAGSPIEVYLSPAEDRKFQAESWWLDETSALIVVSEYIKLLAFILRLGD